MSPFLCSIYSAICGIMVKPLNICYKMKYLTLILTFELEVKIMTFFFTSFLSCVFGQNSNKIQPKKFLNQKVVNIVHLGDLQVAYIFHGNGWSSHFREKCMQPEDPPRRTTTSTELRLYCRAAIMGVIC